MTLGHSHREQFTIGTDLSDQAAVLTVRGRLDIVAVPALSALFDMVVAGTFATVIVDVSGLDSITSECLALLARSAERLTALDRRLVIRSPSFRIARLLDVSGLKDLVYGDSSGSNFGSLTRSGSQVLARPPIEVGSPGPLAKLQMGSEFPSEDDVVDGALRMVVALAQATIAAADGVSISLRRNGRLATVAASDQTILDMDTYQYATGEGPCLDASIEGRAFQTQSLIDERRWPAFTPSAHALGINAILSSPLRGLETAGRGPQHLLAPALGVRIRRSEAGVAVRHRGLHHPHRGPGRRVRRGPGGPLPIGPAGAGDHRPGPRRPHGPGGDLR